jgi:hypothetical protein
MGVVTISGGGCCITRPESVRPGSDRFLDDVVEVEGRMSEQRFLTGSREQACLLPPEMREWLSPDHLVWALCEAVDRIDFSRFEAEYREDGQGRPAYDPRLMATLLL